MSKFPFSDIEIKNYGIATVGERGQIVIPKKIRDKMKIKPGDQFLVFAKAGLVISFIKPENFDTIISKLMTGFTDIKKINK